ncbi:MAG: glycerophosphodiester phosphodiesterase, partial [Rubrobacteraceae bacterium]
MSRVVAHRGAAGLEPENTLRSFRRAAREGADAIELDLRVSHDGSLVVMHDPTVARTTDGTGPV